MTITNEGLKGALKQVRHACEKRGPYVNQVFMDYEAAAAEHWNMSEGIGEFPQAPSSGNVWIIATDGHRVSAKKMNP